jgi:hypothetical protein
MKDLFGPSPKSLLEIGKPDIVQPMFARPRKAQGCATLGHTRTQIGGFHARVGLGSEGALYFLFSDCDEKIKPEEHPTPLELRLLSR